MTGCRFGPDWERGSGSDWERGSGSDWERGSGSDWERGSGSDWEVGVVLTGELRSIGLRKVSITLV